jgi:predicted outer membrane protein
MRLRRRRSSELMMTTGFSRAAFLGLVLGLVALPLATTAVSPPENSPESQVVSSVTARAETAAGRNLSLGEQKFVEGAYARGLVAIGAGQVAFEASSVHEVRLLAAHTLTQRVGIEQKLAALAKTKGIDALPDQLDANSRETLETLAEASQDNDFDLRYCGMLVAGYLREIKAFQGQADSASDPDLRVLAGEIVAELKQHLAIALAVQRALARALDESPALMST